MNITTFESIDFTMKHLYVYKEDCINFLSRSCDTQYLEMYLGIATFLLLWRIFVEHDDLTWKNGVPLGVLILWMGIVIYKVYL